MTFDTNVNGLLDDTEGQWVICDGVDSSTGLPAVISAVIPASWTMVTPLTSLVSSLAVQYSLTIPAAASQVLSSANEHWRANQSISLALSAVHRRGSAP